MRFQPRELAAKALDVPKDVLVNDADQAEEFKQRVLEWGCGQKQLVEWCEGTFDGISDLVCWLVNIAESMSFINDGEVPCDLTDVRLFGTGELVGADDDLGTVKWPSLSSCIRLSSALQSLLWTSRVPKKSNISNKSGFLFWVYFPVAAWSAARVQQIFLV